MSEHNKCDVYAHLLNNLTKYAGELLELGYNMDWLVSRAEKTAMTRERRRKQQYKDALTRALGYLNTVARRYGSEWETFMLKLINNYNHFDASDDEIWYPQFNDDINTDNWIVVRTKYGTTDDMDTTCPVCIIPLLKMSGANDIDVSELDDNMSEDNGDIMDNIIASNTKAINLIKILYMTKVNKLIDPSSDGYPRRGDMSKVQYYDVRPITLTNWLKTRYKDHSARH